jgi:hypothetical protein
MGRITRYLGRITFHLLKYLASPFLVVFSVIFFLLVVFNYFSTNPANTNYLSLAEVSLVFSLLPAIIIFIMKTTTAFSDALQRNKKINLYLEKHLPKIGRISIKARMGLKPYLLVLALSMLLVSLAIYFKSNQTNTSIQPFSSDSVIFFVSYGSALSLFSGWARCYTKEERAIFLLDRFFRRIDFCMKVPRIRLGIKDLREALKSYQKTLPSFYTLKSLEETVGQTQLILDRGNSCEISKVQLFVFRLSSSIKMNDASSFREHFLDFRKFLGENESKEEKILQVNQSRIKENLQNYVFSKHAIKLGFSVLLVTVVAYGISFALSKPLSDFAVEILVAVFALYAAWESISS